MSLDRTKTLEAAQKFLAKGQYDKAIAEYQKIVKADPADVRTWLKIGDIFTRKGAAKEACETYSRVGETYAQQGFFLKAVAVYKQILKLDPTRLETQVRLAEMYEALQLVSDALATYEQVAGAYARAGDVDRALGTLGKMCAIDPQNIPVRIKYAEALSKANRTKEAAEAFEAGAKLLKEQGRMDDYVKVAERLMFHRPDDASVAKELALLYLQRNDPKRALSKLQTCFKADPRNAETLELLAQAFRLLGQTPKTISVYRELARVHQEAGRQDERARILKQILELDPGDAEARQALAGYAAPAGAVMAPPSAAVVGSTTASGGQAAFKGPPSAAIVAPPSRSADLDDEPEIEAADEDEDIVIVDDEDSTMDVEDVELSEPASAARTAVGTSSAAQTGQTSPQQAPAGSMRPAASIPPDVAREAQIARLLTECDVFMRYGLKGKVLDQLRRVLEIDPQHVQARERIKDMLIERGQKAEAVKELQVLAEQLFAARPDRAQQYLRQALELMPNDLQTRERLADLAGAVGAAGPTSADVEDLEEMDDRTLAGDQDDVLFLDEGLGAQPDATGPGVITQPETKLEARTMQDLGQFVPPPMGTEQNRVSGHTSRDVQLPPPPAGAQVYEGASDDDLAPMSPEDFDAAPLRPSRPSDMPARMSLPPGEVEEILEEAEFYVAQGLWDAARATLQDAVNQHPRNVLLREKLQEVDDAAAQEAQKPLSRVPPAQEDEAFMLAEKLAEELGPAPDTTAPGSDVLDVEQVFAQFKKGVEETIGLEDSDTHFDLGIAYKEMGLLDDAIHEFELSMTNAQRECIAHTMIGLCFVEKGEIADAISHFKKGLYADNKTDREELGLYFELGAAYELLHDPKEALYYYQKVQKRDPTFRNVTEKLRALTRPQQPTQSGSGAKPAPQMDDVDRAFDDLMGEGD